jgi:hypothetical protein
MGFLVKVQIRQGNDGVILRGNEDGSVDFVKEIDSEKGLIYSPYKYFATIESALDRVFRMRCNNRDAETLQELLANVREERELLKKEFEGILAAPRPKRRAVDASEAEPTIPRRRKG